MGLRDEAAGWAQALADHRGAVAARAACSALVSAGSLLAAEYAGAALAVLVAVLAALAYTLARLRATGRP